MLDELFALLRGLPECISELSRICLCRSKYFVFYPCTRILLVREPVEQKEDSNIMLLPHLCLMAANEALLHYDDAMYLNLQLRSY